MGILETIRDLNNLANQALCEAEALQRATKTYVWNGVRHIIVDDESTTYQLIDGEWQELPPF